MKKRRLTLFSWVFAVAMTAFCIILFKVLLGLPIPVIAFL